MKAALLIVLSLSALAFAGPAFNTNTNTKNQHQYMSTDGKQQSPAIETLKQWCYSSQMSQPELTASFKKLVGIVETSPEDQSTEAAVMSERVCQGAIAAEQKSTNGQTTISGPDAQAHELIKDVYMDSLIACQSRTCMKQLIKIINSNKVDAIRASYYMTRIAVTDKDSIKEETEVKQLAESFIQGQYETTSEAIERQKLFAVTALVGKSLKVKVEEQHQPAGELKQIAEQVVKTIVERYIKPVGEQEVSQYQEQEEPSEQLIKKIAKRSAALKALANIPGFVLKECAGVEQTLVRLAENKEELSTVRQSAIECLEQNSSDLVIKKLKQITFDQEEPIEVRVAAYRALMTSVWAQDDNTNGSKGEQIKQQVAEEIVGQVVRHCEQERNQQQDDQFVLYAISHLDNLRTSQQPEHQAIKECIAKNKQHYMQIQLLCKKFKQQLSEIRKSSRNYKLEQEFNQIDSGLVIEGDLIYESKHKQQHQYQQIALPKLVRVNMSMPVMGETVNVVEITLRQDQMDEELLSVLKIAKNAKFNSDSMSKVVDSFKSSVERNTNNKNININNNNNNNDNKQQAEADLTIKVDGCTVVYLCLDDFKSSSSGAQMSGEQRNKRSVYSTNSIVDEIIEHLKRKPVAFNRGFNFNLNERIAKVLDVEANVIAGLRFESRASGQSARDFEIVAQVEPRFAFEAIVGPAKITNKKLLQRLSTKTALGLRLRFKQDELVDLQVELPMNTMELFTFETQMVEKTANTNGPSQVNTYNYLPESIYGQEDIYSPDEEFFAQQRSAQQVSMPSMRKFKRSIFETKQSTGKQLVKLMQGKRSFASQVEVSEEVARATGLRGKLRVVASPKDMSFLVQAVAQKYEPRMQGYRVQVQQSQRGQEQKQYILTVSTPNSSIERQMQVRLVQQVSAQRTIVKADIEGAYAHKQMASSLQVELVHDGRQYAVKAEISQQGRHQQRHQFECGVQLSGSGRFAQTYKPYVSVQSTQLKRPIQMQGLVSYQAEPKSVISYEFKCPTSGDFVQGKIILDERQASSSFKRSTVRRSMQSPVERLLQSDITLTSELVAKVAEHAVKVHQMIDWDANKWSLQTDLIGSHKNQRKSSDSQLLAKLKLDQDQQMVSVERKSSQEPRQNYRLVIDSDSKSPKAHQLVAEIRYTGKRAASPLSSVLSYKHQVAVQQHRASSQQQQQVVEYTVELVDSERQFNEKLSGRTQVRSERNMKTIESQIQVAPSKEAKLRVEFVSAMEHQIEFQVQTGRVSHKTSVRADKTQWGCQSQTQKGQQVVAKLMVELVKPSKECKVVVEVPAERVHFAADLKLQSGKRSSLALQSERFSAQTEFAFDSMARSSTFNKLAAFRPLERLHLKGNLKDAMRQEAYWMESQWSPVEKSYLRFDSPVYRSEFEFEPRQQQAKLGLFARAKRSPNSHKQPYAVQESMFGPSQQEQEDQFETLNTNANTNTKMDLANKLWMIRSIIANTQSEQLKQQARRALFEYADRRQSQKHQIKWSPSEQRVNFAFERQPSQEFRGQQQPMRLMGDLTTDLWMSQQEQQEQRPSSLSMESEWIDFGLEAKPFDGQQGYAKLVANSRHRRSPFAKHESEISYKKHQGYKASMKHEDTKQRRHSWQAEADESPKKWAKMSYESDSKLGKGQWEHQWRKQLSKRSHSNTEQQEQEQQVYANKIHFQAQGPRDQWSHQSRLDWEEPSKMFAGRVRRAISFYPAGEQAMQQEEQRRYNTIDYLKHVNARLQSQQQVNGDSQLYKLDFDFQPESHARLALNMPNEMLHQSSVEFQPSERLYKIESKLMNERTKQPSYEFLAATKPVAVLGLASQEQEPVFVEEEHPMLARPVSQRLAANLFKQPLKLDYSDKFGRQARLDYDFAPLAATKYAGLRQKRAALFYKDSEADFEHQSSLDFYPEPMLAGGFKHGQRQSGDFALKAQTKFGPVQLRADSTDSSTELELESPLANAKLTSESVSRNSQLVKLQLDNKHQQVKLAKIVRQTALLNDCAIAHKLAKQIDQARFEHQSELLVSLVNQIFKLKSQTRMDDRQVMTIEGELNKEQDRCFVKINGERVEGQLAVDLLNKSAQLQLDVDQKRTLSHQTRLVRTSDKFYSLETITSHKQKPMLKVQAKICAMMFEEPEHLFASATSAYTHTSGRSASRLGNTHEHLSTFEAQLYEPKQMQITGQYDCLKKEARIVTKDQETKKIQTTTMKYDEQTETIIVDARLSSPYGQIYSSQAKLNLPGLMQEAQCHRQACQSEIFYSSPKSGNWSARYQPGEQIFVNSPHGKQTISLVY